MKIKQGKKKLTPQQRSSQYLHLQLFFTLNCCFLFSVFTYCFWGKRPQWFSCRCKASRGPGGNSTTTRGAVLHIHVWLNPFKKMYEKSFKRRRARKSNLQRAQNCYIQNYQNHQWHWSEWLVLVACTLSCCSRSTQLITMSNKKKWVFFWMLFILILPFFINSFT